MAQTMPPRSDTTEQARLQELHEATIQAQADTILALTALLKIAEHQRDDAQRQLAVSAPRGRHWFVPIEAGDHGICQACGLPESNGRHAPRAV